MNVHSYHWRLLLKIKQYPPSFHTPFGKLSEIQLHKGIQILTEIEEKILKGTHDVMDLTNQFYSVIPVVFENIIDRRYLLDTLEKVQAKKDWLLEMIY